MYCILLWVGKPGCMGHSEQTKTFSKDDKDHRVDVESYSATVTQPCSTSTCDLMLTGAGPTHLQHRSF
ncbi:hypothetical protein Ocin01_11170 [Orchesella cincta]|uniref:Uncharacterized protein n=1 Tax=Orchesella cincta TaxID=48709 RepID=A0A1D2MRH9_ORCCI|nr:hypothetical protein Ocin01_11170 [Orchesella cincta]